MTKDCRTRCGWSQACRMRCGWSQAEFEVVQTGFHSTQQGKSGTMNLCAHCMIGNFCSIHAGLILQHLLIWRNQPLLYHDPFYLFFIVPCRGEVRLMVQLYRQLCTHCSDVWRRLGQYLQLYRQSQLLQNVAHVILETIFSLPSFDSDPEIFFSFKSSENDNVHGS